MAKLYKEGVQISEIYDALEAQGYKTITGRKWTEGNIRSTINKFRKQYIYRNEGMFLIME